MLDTPHPKTDEPEGTRWRQLGVVATVLAVGLLLVVMAYDEVMLMRRHLNADRFHSECESEHDREACGRWALYLLTDGDSFDELRQGLAIWDEMCRDDLVHRPCRYAAEVRSPDEVANWFGAEHAFTRTRAKVAMQKCGERDPRGCLVALEVGAAKKDTLKKVEAACERGDAAACAAWGRFDDGAAAQRAACDAGFAWACKTPRAGRCLDGDFVTCREADSPAERALGALAEHAGDNPGLHMVDLSAGQSEESCEAGSAAACFALGLADTADVNPFEQRVPTEALEVTMGRACDLGANVACYVFAIRLIDRRTPPDTAKDRAAELLDLACERGHARSCWLRAMVLDDVDGELDRYRTAARGACQAAASGEVACQPWIHLLAHDIGAEPWPIVYSEGYTRMRDACWVAGAPRGCFHASTMMLEHARGENPVVPPLFVQGWRLARYACAEGRDREACLTFIEYAKFMQPHGSSTPDELEDRICETVSEACDDSSL